MKTTNILRLIPLFLLAVSTLTVNGQQVRRTKTGILIFGGGDSLRAVEPFHGTLEKGAPYAEAVNRYQQTLGSTMRIYCMIIPTAIAVYCPQDAKALTNDEAATVRAVYSRLDSAIRPIDLFDVMAAHAAEDIYSRTDHHWASLGAYYAACEFARAAGVKVPDLADYDRHVVGNYVGTMARFSRDAAVRNAPEQFVYYTPRDSSYTTTYIRYTFGKNRQVLAEKEPEAGPFFYPYADGSSAAYMTFMHGDTNTTVVKTHAESGRRLLILKDSYGNALPPFLFASFDEIHVVDCRYFLRNIADYARQHAITDVLFANNAGHACSPATHKAYHRYLDQ